MAEPSILQVVLMGMITVFIGLICLIGIIKLMGLIVEKVSQPKAPVPAAVPARGPAAPAADRRRLVAAIAAAIAEEMGEDVEHIKIHSIRKL